MKPNPVKTLYALLLVVTLGIATPGCGDSDSAKTDGVRQNAPSLVGTWQQTAVGGKPVSGIVVKLVFTGRTLTMEAPGCRIIGDYTADEDVLTYTVTSMQGETCATTQKAGDSDRVRYRIVGSSLYLTPLSAGEQGQTEYQRMEADQPSH